MLRALSSGIGIVAACVIRIGDAAYGILRWMVRVRRTPAAAILLLGLTLWQLYAQAPPEIRVPSAVPPGAVVKSQHALCYLIDDGSTVTPVPLATLWAFENRAGIAYGCRRHVRGTDDQAMFSDSARRVVLAWRGAAPQVDEEDLAQRCLDLAEAEERAAPAPAPPGERAPARPGPWGLVVRRAGVLVLAVLLADSLLGLGAWWRSVRERDRRYWQEFHAQERATRGVCNVCEYPLEDLPGGRCPECGTER